MLGHFLDHEGVRHGGLLSHVGWNFAIFAGHTQLIGPGDQPHFQKIDHATKRRLGPHWQLQWHRVGPKPIANHLDTALKISSDAVHFVDKTNSGNSVAVRLPPHSLTLRLNSLHRIKHHNPAIQHPQGALHLCREINMAGGVD